MDPQNMRSELKESLGPFPVPGAGLAVFRPGVRFPRPFVYMYEGRNEMITPLRRFCPEGKPALGRSGTDGLRNASGVQPSRDPVSFFPIFFTIMEQFVPVIRLYR